MARGRGSGGAVLLGAPAVLFVGFLVLTSGPSLAEAARSYMVGDYGGWKFDTVRWARGKTFRAGDVLEFKYNRAVHDVAVVDAAAYRSCRVPRGSRALRSGHEKVKITRGKHYFICTVRGHCKAKMKIAVTVL